jgi:hypothetical protein
MFDPMRVNRAAQERMSQYHRDAEIWRSLDHKRPKIIFFKAKKRVPKGGKYAPF